MTTTAITKAVAPEIEELSKRIKIMVPGGSALKDNEALALAQISQVCHLNPFIGEVWYIPGKGPMVGIRGARRYANEQVKEESGKDAYWFSDIQPCSPDEAGVTKNETVHAAFKCIIHDSTSTFQYQRALTSLIQTLRDGGSPDPYGDAVKIVGPKPQWVGYGYTTTTESTRMNKTQCARKRAEADALKKRFYIPFGAGVSEFDDTVEAGPEWLLDDKTANGETKTYTREQAISELTGTPVSKLETPKTVVDRPYKPEQLKARILEIATNYQKKEKMSATQSQRGLVAGVLSECFAPDPDAEKIRHSVTKYLVGYDSLKDVPGIYILALLDWLQPTKDSGGAYHPDSMAVTEASSVWTEALKDAGQLEMEIK